MRQLRDRIADERCERETRYASWRELIVLLADMSGNRVWRMIARRTRDFLASPPLAEARRALAARSRTHRAAHRRGPRRARGRTHRRRHRRDPAHPAAGERSRRRGGFAARPHAYPERSIPMNDFTLTTPTQEPDLGTAMKVVYQWNYGSEVDELRRLYVKAAEAQWVASRDIDWDRPIDLRKFATTPLGGGAVPIERNSYWQQPRRGHAHRAHPPHGRVPPEQLPARRAGRAHGGGAARERRAAHRREVLRRDADDGRGAPRRGVRPLHREARRPAADRGAAQAHPRRHARDRRLAEEARRHADRRRGAGALQLPRDARAHRGAAAEGPPHLRRARRVAPPRVRRPVRRALRPRAERRRARGARGLRARGGAGRDRQPQPAGTLHGVARELAGGRHRRRRALRVHAARARRAGTRPAHACAGSDRCRAS